MKATLTDKPFSDPDWIYERKLDGVRCMAFRDGGPVRLVSRTGLALDYPELVEALEAEPEKRFVVDGEVVAFKGRQTSFELLQRRRFERVAVYLYAFDVVWLDGYDTTDLPLRSRKRVLKRALGFAGHVRYTPHRNRDGEEYARFSSATTRTGGCATPARSAPGSTSGCSRS
jgi:ATP-dependent DNA ligase